MSDSNENVIWKVLATLAGAGGAIWAVIKYVWTGKKKESYEGDEIKEKINDTLFNRWQKEIEYFRQQVSELRTENAELKKNDAAQRVKIAEQEERIEQLMQRVENLNSDLMTASIKTNKLK